MIFTFASIEDAEEDENLKVRFHIIVPGSQTINDVSLTKPGFHFYNILPATDYRYDSIVLAFFLKSFLF